jgi:hypothetical protein
MITLPPTPTPILANPHPFPESKYDTRYRLKAHIVSLRTGKYEQPPLPPTAEELDGSLGYNKTGMTSALPRWQPVRTACAIPIPTAKISKTPRMRPKRRGARYGTQTGHSNTVPSKQQQPSRWALAEPKRLDTEQRPSHQRLVASFVAAQLLEDEATYDPPPTEY